MPRLVYSVAAWFAIGFVGGATASAQDRCQEPDDAVYVARMGMARTAIEAENFEEALEHLRWAESNYVFAPIEYSVARALHRLERFAEAEAEYNDFMRHFQGCPDPDHLMDAALEYRTLAVRQQGRDQDVTTAPPQEAPPPPSDSLHPGWYVLAAGGALMVGGVVYDLATAHVIDDRDAAIEANDATALSEANSDIRTGRTVDWVLYGVGAAGALAGALLLVLMDPSAPSEQVPAQEGVVIGPGEVGVRVLF